MLGFLPGIFCCPCGFSLMASGNAKLLLFKSPKLVVHLAIKLKLMLTFNFRAYKISVT